MILVHMMHLLSLESAIKMHLRILLSDTATKIHTWCSCREKTMPRSGQRAFFPWFASFVGFTAWCALVALSQSQVIFLLKSNCLLAAWFPLSSAYSMAHYLNFALQLLCVARGIILSKNNAKHARLNGCNIWIETFKNMTGSAELLFNP